jgi:hypothetical protein
MATTRPRGHTQNSFSASAANNQQAQLANAYQELGRELSSEKLKVVGGYTIGRVIGEGKKPLSGLLKGRLAQFTLLYID